MTEEQKESLNLEEASQLIGLQIREGKTKGEIRKELTEKGFDEKFFDGEYQKILMKLEEEEKASRLEPGSIVPALVGGVVAAVLAAIVWSVITVVTDYEIGYMALGVGFLVGYGVYLASGKKRGRILQIFAAFFSVLGIFLAKYFMVYYFLKDMVKTEYGLEAAVEVKLWSREIIEIISEEFTTIFSGYDILWVVLAILVAWGIPGKMKINKKLD